MKGEDAAWYDTKCDDARYFVCKYPAGAFNEAGYAEDDAAATN
jgi:hypothetical protein